MKKKKISIIGSNGLPGRYGGWDQLVEHLSADLSNDYEVLIYTTYKNKDSIKKEYSGGKIIKIYLDANGWQSIPYDIISMVDSIIRRVDCCLILGTSGCLFIPILKLFKIQTILNPDGKEWERQKWGWFVKVLLRFFDWVGTKFADVVVADSEVIRNEIMGRENKKTCLIEYGGDHVKKIEFHERLSYEFNIQNNNYAFKVCRIVPENNIELILECFSINKLPLVIVGNWDVSDWARKLKAKFLNYGNLQMVGPIYDQSLLNQLRSNCRLYVHGHSVGGTNPSLVEAMSLGLPVLAYDVSYNRVTTNNDALYFSNSNELLESIVKYWDDNNYLDNIGKKMHETAHRKYTWKRIVREYRELIE